MKGKKKIKIVVKREYTGEKNIEQAISEILIQALLKDPKDAALQA